MNDHDFKHMPHVLADLKISTKGTEVSQGYKPDLTLCDASGKLCCIMEHENKTDRKAYLGAMLKAIVHAEETQSQPCLVFVMREQKNTTVAQIADHLARYKTWLTQKNGSSLLDQVHVMSFEQYNASNAA